MRPERRPRAGMRKVAHAASAASWRQSDKFQSNFATGRPAPNRRQPLLFSLWLAEDDRGEGGVVRGRDQVEYDGDVADGAGVNAIRASFLDEERQIAAPHGRRTTTGFRIGDPHPIILAVALLGRADVAVAAGWVESWAHGGARRP